MKHFVPTDLTALMDWTCAYKITRLTKTPSAKIENMNKNIKMKQLNQ